MFEDNFEDPEDAYVTGFDEMVTDRSQLDRSDVSGANDDATSLLALSQTPTEFTSDEEGEEGTVYYSLEERNTIDGLRCYRRYAWSMGLWLRVCASV